MASLVKQSSTQLALKFFLVQTSDHITGLTAASPTVTIRKEGGSFATPAGAVTEIASGWYQVAGNATDTNTLGDILLHATAASGDPTDIVAATVVGFDPQAALATPTNITAGTITTVTTVTNQLTAAQIATGVWTDTVAGDFTTALSVGKSLMNGVALGTGLTINAYTGDTPQTGDSFARIGATGSGLTSITSLLPAALSGGFMKCDVFALNTDATSASNIAKTTKVIGRGTASGVPTTTSIPTSAFSLAGAGTVSGQFIGRTIVFDAATATAALQGQATNITANTSGATPTFTVTALTTAPASGDTFSVV